MADERTLSHYQANFERYASEYLDARVSDQQRLILTYFHPSGLSLDVGCASGRDLLWLRDQGFRVEGLDAVEGFVQTCRERLPEAPIYHDQLPALPTLLGPSNRRRFESRYDNLLASATLMHLPQGEIPVAIDQLRRLLRPGGRMLISARRARPEEERQSSEREGERLFTPLTTALLTKLGDAAGLATLFSEERAADEQGKHWVTVVFERVGHSSKGRQD